MCLCRVEERRAQLKNETFECYKSKTNSFFSENKKNCNIAAYKERIYVFLMSKHRKFLVLPAMQRSRTGMR
jgi:hypothetical protein